jgi:hypothetical protein
MDGWGRWVARAQAAPAGYLVVLRDAHRVRNDPSTEAPPLDSVLAQHGLVNGELHLIGSDAPTSEIICGTFST